MAWTREDLKRFREEIARQNAESREHMRKKHPPSSKIEVKLEALTKGARGYLPIVSNGEIIGELHLDGSDGKTLVLDGIKINGAVENQGFATEVLTRLVARAKEVGFRRITGNMRGECRKKLLHLYGKYGAVFNGLDGVLVL